MVMMAVLLHQGLAASWGGRKWAAFCSRNSLRMKVLAESRLASSSMGKRLISSSRKTATQLGSSPTTGSSGLDLRPEGVEDLPQQLLGRLEHAEVVEGPAAAERAPGHDHLEARGLEHLDGRDGRLRVEMVVERVGPEHDARPAGRLRAACAGTRT